MSNQSMVYNKFGAQVRIDPAKECAFSDSDLFGDSVHIHCTELHDIW